LDASMIRHTNGCGSLRTKDGCKVKRWRTLGYGNFPTAAISEGPEVYVSNIAGFCLLTYRGCVLGFGYLAFGDKFGKCLYWKFYELTHRVLRTGLAAVRFLADQRRYLSVVISSAFKDRPNPDSFLSSERLPAYLQFFDSRVY